MEREHLLLHEDSCSQREHGHLTPAGFVIPLLIAVLILAGAGSSLAWDYEGHRLIAQLALRSLPTNFPGFVRLPESIERVAYLSGEPDRWRNSPDLPFAHSHKPDHFFDIDELPLYGIKAEALSPFRYEAVVRFETERAANPTRFSRVDPSRDLDLTRGRIGYLPWTITEHQGRLKSDFACLRAFEMAGTASEKANSEQSILYVMGVMAHFVGDAVQPLHTTRHYNGWTGQNPKGYTTNRTFHSWIDGGFPGRLGLDLALLAPRVRPAQRIAWEEAGASKTNVFPAIVKFIERSSQHVEPLYQLDRDGKLPAKGPPPDESREFIIARMVEGAQMLGDLWLTAWLDAPPDYFLKAQLDRRRNRSAGTP